MTPEKVKAFAIKQGYKGADFIKVWNGYRCYEPFMNDDVSFVGLPLVIMEKGGTIRMSTPEEALKI